MGTTSTATVTRTELIEMAMRRLGNNFPSASEIASAVTNLNTLLKRIDIQGRWLWAINATYSSLTLSSGTSSYSTGTGANNIGTNILSLEKVYYMQSASSSVELDIYDKSQFIGSTLRDDSGQPQGVYLETAPVLANQKLWVLPEPDSSYSLQYYFRRRLYEFSSASDNPDLPGEWVDVLKKELALDLAPEYGVPPAILNELRMDVQEARRLVNAENAESAPERTVQTIYF